MRESTDLREVSVGDKAALRNNELSIADTPCRCVCVCMCVCVCDNEVLWLLRAGVCVCACVLQDVFMYVYTYHIKR